METNVDEIAEQIYRISTFVPEAGLVFNQFLIDADQPLLFHTGLRSPRRPQPSFRSSGCAGSPSVTTRPTSAER
jgi:hypothetical protein